MKRITFGISFLLLGLLLKVIFGHLAKIWSEIEFYSYLCYVIGFIILVYKIVIKSERKVNRKAKNPILNWIYKKPFLIYIFIIPIIIFLLLAGEFLNIKLRDYYLERKTNETLAEFVGFDKQSFLVKYSYKVENFAIFKYKTGKGIITQGLKKKEFEKFIKRRENLKNKIKIVYSVEYPSFFKIRE
jgi:hypothetical protein